MIRLLLVEGERGSGKTSALREAARLARTAGLRVAGLLTEQERDEAGMPLQSRLVDLAGGESRLLALRGGKLGGPSWPPAGRGPAGLAPFSFSEEAFAWGLARLEAALDAAQAEAGGLGGEEAPLRLLILDEVGPVELELGLGFAPFLTRLEAAVQADRGAGRGGGGAKAYGSLAAEPASNAAPGASPGTAADSRRGPLVALAVRSSLRGRLAERLAKAGAVPALLAIGDAVRAEAPRKILGLL